MDSRRYGAVFGCSVSEVPQVVYNGYVIEGSACVKIHRNVLNDCCIMTYVDEGWGCILNCDLNGIGCEMSFSVSYVKRDCKDAWSFKEITGTHSEQGLRCSICERPDVGDYPNVIP